MAKKQAKNAAEDNSYRAAVEADLAASVETVCNAAEQLTEAADQLARAHTHTTLAVRERTQDDARKCHEQAEKNRGKAITAIENARTLLRALAS